MRYRFLRQASDAQVERPPWSDGRCRHGALSERQTAKGVRPFQGKEQGNEEARLAGRRKRASMLNMCLTGRVPAIGKSMSDPEIQQRRAGRLYLAREDCYVLKKRCR